MRVRSLVFAIALVGGLLTPSTSVAAPVRLDFAGNWKFYDGFFESAAAADFWNAMNASGVFQDSPLTLSLLLDDRDLNVDPTRGRYSVTGSVNVGTVSLTLLPTYLEVLPDDIRIAPGTLVGLPAGSYEPFFFQFGNDSAPVMGDDLLSAVAELEAYRSLLFVGYRSSVCGYCLGFSQPTLTKVDVVPEPTISFFVLSGSVVLLVRWRRVRSPHPVAHRAIHLRRARQAICARSRRSFQS